MSDIQILTKQGYDFKKGVLDDIFYENDNVYNHQYWADKQKLSDAAQKYFPDAAGYLNNRLHDAWVVESRYVKYESLKLTFNDYYYIDFATALMGIEKIKIARKKLMFPVTLEFNGLKKCGMYWSNRNNKLIPVKIEKYLPKLKQYLYDEIQEAGEHHLGIGLCIWSSHRDTSKYNLFMQIMASKASVAERQKESLYQLFDQRYYALLDAFCAEIDKKTDFDYTVAGNFIKANRHLIC